MVHFAVDMVFAIPLLLIPEIVLPWFGWTVVDPLSSRLVGAALLAVGGESLLSRNASREVYQALLNLKIIWASSALIGIGLALLQGAPGQAWFFLVIFAAFLGLWIYYKIQLKD